MSSVSMQDKRELERTTRVLALKVAQIIVQSRSGEKVKSDCKPNSFGTDWFNLAIQDSPEVSTETKRSLHEELISSPIPLCVEISVRTVEGQSTVLETWVLGVLSESSSPTAKLTHTVVYNRMGTLLKSLLAVSRMTPAYKISRRQGPDAYVICYRIFMGEPQIQCLGDNYKHIRVGQVNTPVGTVHLSVSYRTKMTFAPDQHKSSDSISLKSDHFQAETSPPNPRKAEFSSDTVKLGAFAASKPFFSNEGDQQLDIPFNSLLSAHRSSPSPTIEKTSTESASDTGDGSEPSPNTLVAKSNSRNGSRRSSCSITSANDGFIMVDLKTPFATTNTNTDLGTFYRECQNAPQLQAFVDEQTLEQQIGDLTKQLENFETNMQLYENFVDSLCQSKTIE